MVFSCWDRTPQISSIQKRTVEHFSSWEARQLAPNLNKSLLDASAPRYWISGRSFTCPRSSNRNGVENRVASTRNRNFCAQNGNNCSQPGKKQRNPSERYENRAIIRAGKPLVFIDVNAELSPSQWRAAVVLESIAMTFIVSLKLLRE